ncbi:MAG: heavy metal-responsive transcriptional regulator [Acidobacteriota bacterium]
MDSLTISQVATRGGINLQTVRYYEHQGLLAPTSRTEAGYRIFSAESVRRIRFIKRAQELGFSLKEIKGLLSLRIDAHTTQADIRQRTQGKIADVEQKILHLQAIHATLLRMAEDCSGCGPLKDCPILESLDKGESS